MGETRNGVETIKSLRVVALLHEGPRTDVYRAVAGEETVILKVLKANHDDAANRARLEREMHFADEIDSPFVVRARGLSTFQGRFALMLEDFGGESLARMPPRDLDASIAIAVSIARGLGAIHRLGIIHRDIKPANVVQRASTGEVKITDFGIALHRGDPATQPGTVLEGTLAYMAPEQTRRMHRDVDHRSDLYSLGVVLYELFCGRHPFAAEDAVGWLHAHAARIPVAPTEIAAVPPALSSIILKLLAKAPEDRYQSAVGLERDLLRARTETEPFALGETDVDGEFRLPSRMFGRDAETAALTFAFARVSSAKTTETLVIAGYSGVGKTALIRQLQPATLRDGYFIEGKFDQYRSHVPYSGLIQAGESLVQQLLAISAGRLASFRAQLLEALDGNGRVLLDLFPDLERIIGAQPALVDLSATGTQNRLQLVVRSLFRAVPGPVVLFLDDVQWIDPASLELLEAVASSGTPAGLLTVLAYRDNEVDDAHPLVAFLERLRTTGSLTGQIALAPLGLDAMKKMVEATVRLDRAGASSLANLLLEKTEGNPFFAREFLRTLHLGGALRFDPSSASWILDLDAAATLTVADNVVHLLVARLDRLAPVSREALRLASFLGHQLELDDLALVMKRPLAEVASALAPAIEQGLLTMHVASDGKTITRFGHDRVQQAAYALTPERERPQVHLRVGRSLAEGLGESAQAARVFEVASHLDSAFSHLTVEERERYLPVFLDAGQRAKRATAYRSACSFYERASEIVTDRGWSDRFAVAFETTIALAESKYLAGELESALAIFAQLKERARDDLERARVFYLQIRLFQVAGDLATATELSFRSFELFGLHPPKTDEEAAKATEEQFAIVSELLGDRPIAARVFDPVMTDPRMRMLSDLLEASAPPIYMVRPALFPWVALQLVSLALLHGNAEASCYGYGIYALLRAAVIGDPENGLAFSQLAIALNEKLGAVKLEGCMLHLLGDHVNFWKNPIATDLPILERGFAACARVGDHIYANYIGFQSPWHLYESGAPIAAVHALIERSLAFAADTHYVPVQWTLRAERQFLAALEGDTASAGGLDAPGFSSEEACAAMTAARFGCGVVYLHILDMIARYTFGDLPGALRASDLAAPELGAAFSMPMYVSYTFYRALILAALHPSETAEVQAKYLEEIRAHRQSLAKWAGPCPANFADKASLLSASIAWLEGDVSTALRNYEQARLQARAQGFLQYEALACELAAAAYGSMGVDSLRRMLLADAAALYRRWGATGKATRLFEQQGGVDRAAEAKEIASRFSTTSDPTTAREIDMISVHKAAQSLSAEIVPARLLSRLMSIVIENAGATRGALVLLEDDRMVVAAEASASTATSSALPSSILEFVRRTGELVVIDDASSHHRFAGDSYFASATHRSVLCKPMERQGRMLGMFYLENDLVARAFGPNRLVTLELLASQAAISIENSRLYQASQTAVEARDEFLSIASHELRTPLAPLTMTMHRITSAIRKGTLKEMPTESLSKMVTTIDAQIARLSRLVGALLDVSRIGSGTFVLEREPLDVGLLVTDAVERYGTEASIALTVEPGVVGRLDKMRIEQVLANLLINALKFGRDRPVEIAVGKEKGEARVRVADHGVGIAVGDRERIFQRFERVRSTNNVDGLGLGLFITRAIVEAHGGGISVEETPGGGATFIVRLPLA